MKTKMRNINRYCVEAVQVTDLNSILGNKLLGEAFQRLEEADSKLSNEIDEEFMLVEATYDSNSEEYVNETRSLMGDYIDDILDYLPAYIDMVDAIYITGDNYWLIRLFSLNQEV